MRLRLLAFAALFSLAACGKAPTPPVTEGVTDALIASAPDDEWLTHGRDYSERRFSPLKQIAADNVGELGLAWSYDLDTARGQEATPLVHDGTIYITSAWSKVFAFDGRTGKLKWSYDPEVPRETLNRACCDAVNRGVALYGDKVYVATLNGLLIALDQETGAVAWSKTVVPNQVDYTITGAPRIANGLVVIGSGGAEYKARGYIAAYDHETGDEVWKFHTVPGNPDDGFESDAMKRAAATWQGEWWDLGGGGTVWDGITYDPETNLVLFGTGNAEPWNPAPTGRKGASLYTSSIVAVHADTGKYAWHFQETPGDQWDYDSNNQITIADMEIDGEIRHVALHAPKNGFFYVIDAKTGEFLSAEAYAPQNWSLGIDSETGIPSVNPEARYHETGKPWIGLPGVGGAHNWQPMSFSPDTGLVYIPVNLAAFPFMAAKDWEPSDIGFQTAQASDLVAMPADKGARAGAMAATTGALVAWDPKTQKEAWRIDYPAPWNGGTLATAGNLVFQGDAQGRFNAYSADSGAKLWSFDAQTGVMAGPVTYAIDGEQYVAVLAGWGGVWDVATGILASKGGATRNISRLLVFKIGGKGELADPPPMNEMVLDPPPFNGTEAQVAHGGKLYGRYCSVCHGDAAVAGALNPDLRHSATLNDVEAMKAIVIDGALKHNGMVSFKSAMGADDAAAIMHYLIKRANEDKDLGD